MTKVGITLWVLCFTFFLIACQERSKKNSASQNVPTEGKESQKASEKVIVFFGNSLTAGYGIDPDDAFPALIQKRLDSLGYNYKVVDAGVSGETTASGLTRVNWVLDQSPDIFILELGGNDGLRGIPLDETRKNLAQMIDLVRDQNSDTKVILAGMMIPPNMGQKYTEEFRTIFPDLSKEKDVALIPFLLENVGGEPDLNLPDMIHPNEEGHKVVAGNVWEILKPLLQN